MMGMQVVAVLGGKRNGNTHNLLKFLERALNQADLSLEIIHLSEMHLESCKGCENCVLGSGCAIQDDMQSIGDTMTKADGLIIASPVYNNNVTGKLKMFIDRTAKWAHSPFLTGKPYLGLSTTSSSGLKFTLQYLEVVGVNWGAHPVGSIWASKRTTHMKRNKATLAKFITTLRHGPKAHRPTINQVIKFQTKKVLAKTVFPNDFGYWKAKGWLDEPYYYPCKLSLLKRAVGAGFSRLFLKIISRATEKYRQTIGTKEYGKLVYE
jgi:multimeric flavodoxin WrbA